MEFSAFRTNTSTNYFRRCVPTHCVGKPTSHERAVPYGGMAIEDMREPPRHRYR